MSELVNETAQSSRLAREVRDSGKTDDQLFRDLMDRFTILAERCAQFSREIYRWSGTPPEADIDATVRRNLDIVRTVFGKWSLEILAVIRFSPSIAFLDLRDALGRISSPMLTAKLRELERARLIQRDVVSKRPPASRYSLTHTGMMIARLGEPVFLYLRLVSGWQKPPPGAVRSDDEEEETAASLAAHKV